MNKVKNVLCNSILLLIWGGAYLAHHLACFDVFQSNLWYLYLVAVVLAAAELVVLLCLNRRLKKPTILIACMVTYLLGALSFATLLLADLFTPGCSWGLALLCAVLDAGGAMLTYRYTIVRE